MLLILNSCSSKRSEAPAQCVVEPPTALTIQAGRLAKSLATRQLPEVVRMSVQASWVKLSHSSLTKSCSSIREPASRITTLTPFCASSLPSVPPPAPEPTITTTPLSFRSNFAMLNSSLLFVDRGCLRLREPVDVGKAALDVAAVFGGGALVAELRPELFLVIEGDDQVAANLLEEGGLLDLLQQRDAFVLPLPLGVGNLVTLVGRLIELGDTVGDQRLDRGILGRLAVPRLDRGDVVAVAQEVVRIDIARDLHQRLQRRRRQCGGVVGPGVADSKARAGRDRDGWHGRGRALQEDATVIFASTIDFSHWCPPLNAC